jgi:hypothetical protein
MIYQLQRRPKRLDNGRFEYHISCPDVPEFLFIAKDSDDFNANIHAFFTKCLQDRYVLKKLPVPLGVYGGDGSATVRLDMVATIKLQMWNAMLANGLTVSGIRRELNWSHDLAMRATDITRESTLPTLEKIFNLMGVMVEFKFNETARRAAA